ncbi:MAG: Mth938-like domain-containing protein [Gammaproteobacteria bacterium]
MKISQDTGTANYRIRGYAAGQVTVNDQVITRSVILLPERLIEDWPPQTFQALAAAHFAQLAILEAEIILIGTGAELKFPAPALLMPLYNAGIGVEVMDTGAACRTYNVLMAEGRAVAAALLMI